MKKPPLLLFVLLALAAPAGLAAKVTVSGGLGGISVTWTWQDAEAAKVGLVADFQGWNAAAPVPFVRGEGGLWTLKLEFPSDRLIRYKIWVDGSLRDDPEAPGQAEDGFGGRIALTRPVPKPVATVPGAPGAAPGSPAAEPAVFTSVTQLGLSSIFNTSAGYGFDRLAVNADSRLGVSGRVTSWLKTSLRADLVSQGEVGLRAWNPGLEQAASLAFAPYSNLDGGSLPALSLLSTTLELPWLDIQASTGSAAVPPAANTLTGDFVYNWFVDSGAGPGMVSLRSKPRTGPAAGWGWLLAPNRRDNLYGLYSRADFSPAEGQLYSLFYAVRGDSASRLVTDLPAGSRWQTGFGLKGTAAPFSWKLDSLYAWNLVDGGAQTAGAWPVGLAGGGELAWAPSGSGITAQVRWAGPQSQPLYGDATNLNPGRWSVHLNGYFNLLTLRLGTEAGYEADAWADPAANTVWALGPYAVLVLSTTQAVSAFVQTGLETGPSGSQVLFKEANLRWKSSTAVGPLQSLLASWSFQNQYTPRAGGLSQITRQYQQLYTTLGWLDGLWSAGGIWRQPGPEATPVQAAAVVPWGAFAGWTFEIKDEDLKKPKLFVWLDWNLDVRDALNPQINESSFHLAAPEAGTGWSRLQAGIRWDF